MRVCYVGNFSQIRSTEGYVADSLVRLGVDVLRVQESTCRPHEFVHHLRQNKPDVVMSSKFEFAELPFKSPKAVRSLRLTCRSHSDGSTQSITNTARTLGGSVHLYQYCSRNESLERDLTYQPYNPSAKNTLHKLWKTAGTAIYFGLSPTLEFHNRLEGDTA